MLWTSMLSPLLLLSVVVPAAGVSCASTWSAFFIAETLIIRNPTAYETMK